MPRLQALIGACLALSSAAALATDIARAPLSTRTNARPSVVFGVDNSGSMDYEVMLSGTIDGNLWWSLNRDVMSGWTPAGKPLYGGGMPKFSYLFPNGCDIPGRKQYCEASGDGQWSIAPTPQLAAMRSSDYNPIYYDSRQTYRPWAPGTIDGTLRTYADSPPHAARADPLYPYTVPLDVDWNSTESNFTFHMTPGMVVPAGARIQAAAGDPWVPVTAAFTVPADKAWNLSMSWYPATFWVKATCTANGVDCAAAPDGATLKRFEIRPGATFPSGRAYADEMQNFANWFTYARKRRFMLASSMGRVLGSFSNLRAGIVTFLGNAPVTMVDTGGTDPRANGATLLGVLQSTHSGGSTPARETLAFIGEQFRTNRGVITSTCQRSAAVMVTDGFANLSPTTPPAYDARLYGAGAPYATTWPASQADIALSYYTNNLRPDLATNASAPVSVTDTNPLPHMNTYGITLGAAGLIWPARTDAFAAPPVAWPNPDEERSPKAIDDLWHATVNGRGLMLRATNADDTAAALGTVLSDISRSTAAQSGVAFSNATLSATDATAYVGSFQPQGWSGDIEARAVDPRTGVIAGTALWSANALLTAADWRRRRVFSFDGRGGVAFTAANVGARLAPMPEGGNAASLVDYLRGDRSREVDIYRPRLGVMGADVDAEPVVDRVQGVVYGVTNDGMVHALDRASGQELWAYVPGFGLGTLGATARPDWVPQTVLDATPTLVQAGARRLLVGGRGSAGAGFYALDVGSPREPSEARLAAQALWEFPSAASASPTSGAAQVAASVGVSMGKPLVVDSTTWGWVVLVTSGYNTARDGRGRLFVLDAATGVLRAEIATSIGSPGAGDAGLAQVSAFAEPSGKVRRVYGGDLLGNLWRFDLDAGTATRIAILADAQGNPLPVTAAPELGTDAGRRMVYVGTGRLLGASDLADTSTNSFFAIRDIEADGAPAPVLRSQLAVRSVTATGGVRHVTGDAVDWQRQRGWLLDLPAGEKANTDPSLALGVLSWTTNLASSTACMSTSVIYAADPRSGLELPASSFPSGAWYGVVLSQTLASRSSPARLADGSLVLATQQADSSLTRQKLLVPGGSAPRRSGWREIRR